MSYILDALKKLEKEKGRKIGSGNVLNISGDLFAGDAPREPRQSSRIQMTILVVAAAAIACGVTYWYLKPGQTGTYGKGAVQPARPVVVSTPVAPAVSPVPVAAIPPAASVTPPIPQVSTALSATGPAPKSQSTAANQVNEEDSEAGVRKTRRKGERAPAQQQKQAVKSAMMPPAAMIAPPGDIKVLGVAWQEERNARRAVINGFLMQEGSTVSGARITEIMTDRVRFSSPSGTFDVPMVSSGTSPAGR